MKINSSVYAIRLIEETFALPFNKLSSYRNCIYSEEGFSDDTDCVYETLNSLDKVPETILSSSLRCGVVGDGQRPLVTKGLRKVLIQILKWVK